MLKNQSNNMMTWHPMRSLMDDFMRLPDLWDDNTSSWLKNNNADMCETETEVCVKMPLAGVKPEDVDITIEDGMLTIKGEMKNEEEQNDDKKNYYHKQIRYGNFIQSFALPSGVKAEETKADFKNGMLFVKVPKSEEAKPRQIKVNVE
jgi:HSP20 family protein